jgi:alpha-mannosidase
MSDMEIEADVVIIGGGTGGAYAERRGRGDVWWTLGTRSMPMTESELVWKQGGVMLREVIEPAVYASSVGLEVEAHLRGDPRAELISPERAWSERYERVGVGYRWGPKWATCWFRVRGEVPAGMAGRTVGLRFSTATEGLVWRRVGDGWEPAQGLDVHRDFARLHAKACGGEGGGGGLNQLWLHHDRPHMWDAWDLDEAALEMGVVADGPAESVRAEQVSPWRASVRVERRLGRASRIVQTYVLDAGSPRLLVRTWVDWRERHTWLRAVFPTAIRAPRAAYEIQFGHVERSTGVTTPVERAMFEVCAHGWMDLSQAGMGLAILNDCKYGHSCRGGVMALSLLRSPTHPDPEADQGEHEFTYAMMPHGGDWRAAGVDREGEALNMPLRVLGVGAGGTLADRGVWAPVEVRAEGGAGVMISAFKASEDGRGIVLRFWESHGRAGRVRVEWKIPVRVVERVDLLERPLAVASLSHEGATTTLAIGAFEIVTLRVERAEALTP